MITADLQSTATLNLGQRYLLGIVNGSLSAVDPTFSGAFGTAAVVPENSTTAFTVASGATKWITFYAFASELQLNATADTIFWILTPID